MNLRTGNGTFYVSPWNMVAAGLAALVFVGSFGAWQSIGSGSVSGTDTFTISSGPFLLASSTIGMHEGVATLILAVVALVGIALAVFGSATSRPFGAIIAAVAFALAAAVAVVAWTQIQKAASDLGAGSVGWGAMLCAVAAAAGGVLSLLSAFSALSLSTGEGSAIAPSFSPSATNVGGGYTRTDYEPATLAETRGRVGVLEHGRPMADVPVRSGSALVVGRDARAQIHLNDPKASRRHLEVRLEADGWVVRDLGATNPASIMSSDGRRPMARNSSTRLRSGQLSIGESVITLYPVGR